ncbi:hypothetical protein GCM10011341_10590 [Frigidibacter albus]|nr:hypothetical protein GCM10011341_10590 [Frigidibacter albus]
MVAHLIGPGAEGPEDFSGKPVIGIAEPRPEGIGPGEDTAATGGNRRCVMPVLPKRGRDAEHLTGLDVQHDDLVTFGRQPDETDVARHQQMEAPGRLPLVKDRGAASQVPRSGQGKDLAQLSRIEAAERGHCAKLVDVGPDHGLSRG